MTIHNIETVQTLIDEMQADGTMIGSVWKFVNSMDNKTMFAVFTAHQFCDMHCSPNVKNPERIWAHGKFIGDYTHLNQDRKD